MLEKLRKLNDGFVLVNATDKEALKYGKKVDYDFTQEIDYIKSRTAIPADGVIYTPHIEGAPCGYIEANYFGGMPIQMGVCHGFNSMLNGLEYHKCSEIVVAITDTVLLVAHLNDMDGNTIDSKHVIGIYLEAGSAFEMYQTTLHYAPCKLSDEGFMSIIILAKGTNLPLDITSDDVLLFMSNKWLLVHPDDKDDIEAGAFVGIKGENIELKY